MASTPLSEGNPAPIIGTVNSTLRVPRIASIIILLVVALPLFGELPTADIRELLDETGAVLEWDEFGRTGVLWGSDESIGFTPGEEIAVVGFSDLLHVEPILYHQGRLLVPESTRAAFADLLGHAPARLRTVTAIVVDAGHGGHDPGTYQDTTVNGQPVRVMEKDLTLDLARRVQAALRPQVPESLVLLTRDSDVYLELGERTEYANSLREDETDNILFVSIHVNSSSLTWTEARGMEVYYLPPDHDRQVLDPTFAASLDPEVSTIVNDLREEEYTRESVMMGQSVLDAVSRQLPETPIERGINVANFFVVREARMPSILIEVGFLNNRQELVLLQQSGYRQRLADAIAAGIAAYVDDFETVH
jgi:N-acetylmuramoyl-L-alanine amidase